MTAKAGQPKATRSGETRERLLEAAAAQFAERGFYGVSIADVADALGLTKQALLHHFRSKEKLYAEVLGRLEEISSDQLDAAAREQADPARRLEAAMTRMLQAALEDPGPTRLVIRELLDNPSRAGAVEQWRFKPYLDRLVRMARDAPAAAALTDAEILNRLFAVIGAISYFAVSAPTLARMYGETHFSGMAADGPETVRRMLRATLTG